MTRPRSELLRSVGTAWEIFRAIANEVLSIGGDDHDLRRILRDDKLRRDIAFMMVTYVTTKDVASRT